MNNNNNWNRRSDERYRSTARGNNGVLERSRGFNYVNHESGIYEDEFGERNNPGYHSYHRGQQDTVYDNPYGYDQGNVNDNTAHSYNSYYRRSRNSGPQSTYRGNDHDDRNFFERAGERIRDKWNELTDNDHDDERYYRDSYGDSYGRNQRYNNSRGRGYDDDRNFFERAGEKIREKWNEWTDNDHDDRSERGREYRSERNGPSYGSYNGSRYDDNNYGYNRRGRSDNGYGRGERNSNQRGGNYYGRSGSRYNEGFRY